MTIDITKLLLGGAKMLPDGESLPEEDGTFSLELEEKLAEMGLLIPGLAAELLPENSAALPASDEALAAIVGEDAASAALSEKKGGLAVLPALTTEEGAVSPQWQLQQLITGKGQPAGMSDLTPGALTQTQGIRHQEGSGEILVKPLKGEAAPKTLRTNAEGVASAMQGMPAEAMQPDAGPGAEATLPVNLSPVLPSSSRSPASIGSQPAVTIPHSLDTPEWKQAISQQVVMMSRNGVQNAEIRLHPEELGSLHITLRLQQEQAKIHIVSDHALVRQVLEQAIPQLRTAMADSGIQLGQANVSADNPFADRQMNGEHGSGGQHAASQSEDNSAEEENVPVVLTPVKNAAYGINTFA
ncbi:flagellar hook-length control protein FliK [Enterobacter sp. CC120223-11]|uniref:flagellar hook-length control protein FliK n=1 Tax=Enterobacter sp. CC120223-11 TaxID=1378073 RepID=UPI000BCE6972|nr:flagellar hook-length control protein FliK [Enterobacter sp. CC120223-11]SNY67843.1 flagellar hook-length control protein FliK [Enterobacter sp. CC120223-11]